MGKIRIFPFGRPGRRPGRLFPPRGVDYPRDPGPPHRKTLYAAALLSLIFYAADRAALPSSAPGSEKAMRKAAEIMADATRALQECRTRRGGSPDPRFDINRTGLIGLETSSITSSLGQLEAKRTTLNPNFAALAVRLLLEAGARPGDTIAVGASGSFPGLILAALSAARALEIRPLVISSLGASQWGANDPAFHWFHMADCLRAAGIFPWPPAAVTLGGGGDIGEDMAPEGRALLRETIRRSGRLTFEEPDLPANVSRRMQILEAAAGDAPIRAFVNIGGAVANMGDDAEILHVRPGLSRIRRLPALERRGLLFAMAARGIPVLHLLYVRGLAQRYGLPWDPSPLPRPGEGDLFHRTRRRHRLFTILALVYLAAMAGAAAHFRLASRPPAG